MSDDTVPPWVYRDDVPQPDGIITSVRMLRRHEMPTIALDDGSSPRVGCSECNVTMLGQGRLRHLGTMVHEWEPYRASRSRRPLVVGGAVVLAVLLVLAVTR